MSMLQWIKQEECSSLILFVHGLKGGVETWSYDKETSFPSLLAAEDSIKNDHDIAYFEYFTTFTNFYGKIKSLRERMFKSFKKNQKNLPIEEIAELLKTEIQVNLSEYENIVIIAHSMGGLVAKACMLSQLEESKNTPVKGFVSLAVPHSGAKGANIGGMISSNVQVRDLSVFSDAIDSLSRRWLHLPNKPTTKYLYATYDQYVDKKSALAIESTKKDSLAVAEDHSSICKPKNTNQTVYKAVVGHILDFSSSYSATLAVGEFVDQKQYDDEYFVLKMVIADIHEDIAGHAKEYFYNAELARKIFTSDSDRRKLSDLYQKIKFIYQEEYEKYLVDQLSSDSLISSVHSRVMKEDVGYLKSLLVNIDNVHKKGMLHQLANKKNRTVVWSSDTCLDILGELKGDNHEW